MAAKTTKIVYDPTKNYIWDPKDKFAITGEQFASLYHLLHQEINAPGGTSIAMKNAGYDTIMDILKKGVVRGKIKEMVMAATVSGSVDESELQNKADGMFAVKDSQV